MSESDKNPNHAQDDKNNQSVDEFKPFDLATKLAKYANIRATDLPTVQRLYLPKPSTIRSVTCSTNPLKQA